MLAVRGDFEGLMGDRGELLTGTAGTGANPGQSHDSAPVAIVARWVPLPASTCWRCCSTQKYNHGDLARMFSRLAYALDLRAEGLEEFLLSRKGDRSEFPEAAGFIAIVPTSGEPLVHCGPF